MSKIKIISDTSCDIQRHYKEELDIALCPLSVTIDGETYREWYDITPSEFMEKLVVANDFPKTALAGPELFLMEYKAAEKAGFDEAIVITIASTASGTHQSAKIAAEMYEDEGGKCKITIVDSKKLSFAYGIFVIAAGQMAKQGKSTREILERIEYLSRHSEVYFGVDTLEYLKKGGRINAVKATVGSLLDLKPILSLKGGKVEPLDTVRGSKRVFSTMLQYLKDNKGKAPYEKVYFGFSGDDSKMKKLMEKYFEEFGECEYEVFEIGVVVGAHAGPGLAAVFVINPEFEAE